MRPDVYGELLGNSAAIAHVRREIARVADSDARVLITGESGTGKELVARAIHARSRRAAAPFIPVNCGGLSETLLESELFGHVRGSFTDAYRDKAGTLETAHGGTVFLDEVAEMSLRMQALLLRFLETGELQKVGADKSMSSVDVRVVAATNATLSERVQQGQFREDLYYRLNVIHLHVPALRERAEDIRLLAAYLLEKQDRSNDTPRRLSADAIAALTLYAWPGNVRELESVVERLLVTTRSGQAIRIEDLPLEVRAQQSMAGFCSRRERHRTVSDDLFRRLIEGGDSFWTVVYPLYKRHEITRENMRDLVGRALKHTRGNYRVVTRLFNMPPQDYRRFLSFLRKHGCLLPFREYR